MVLELMGRDAGHIALHAGIAGGADMILLPEIPFNYDPLVKKVESLLKRGQHYSIVVVAEGAFEKGSKPNFKTVSTSKYATQHLGGIGAMVAEKLHELTKVETRITVLGHVQRGGSPNAFDRILASQMGVFAVDLVHQRKFGVVAGINDGRLSITPYKDILGKTRPLSLDSSYIRTAEGLGICLGR
jgi:6-phosphofructokinase 1